MELEIDLEFLTNIGYNESPFFLYDKRRKTAKFINREAYLNIGVFNQPSNNSNDFLWYTFKTF